MLKFSCYFSTIICSKGASTLSNVVFLHFEIETYVMENLNEKSWIEGFKASDRAEIIDVRTPDEFNEGYIEGAKLMNIQESSKFIEDIEQLPKDKDYYVYCRSGKRSEMACQLMNKAGIDNAYNLEGGILGWTGDVKK